MRRGVNAPVWGISLVGFTPWHITFSTYGARLHGDERLTVDRQHNVYGTPYLDLDTERNARAQAAMSADPVVLTREQQRFIESVLSGICTRGGWRLITCAAGPDHVHLLVVVEKTVHGKRVRALVKRWLTQALNQRWSVPSRSDGMSWWCEGGSTKAVKDGEYFANVVKYIDNQRCSRPFGEDGAGPEAPAHPIQDETDR